MSCLLSPLRRGATVGALLALAAGAAFARVDFSIGLGFPLGAAVDYGYRGAADGLVYGALPAAAVSVQIGGGGHGRHRGGYHRPWGPRWLVVAPPLLLPIVVADPPQAAAEAAPPPAPEPSRPDPVIYPRNGQSAVQTESDRQACNRWATTQPAALADAAVFHRAVESCMDGRGYTMK